jgi:hypothetical protein
MLIGRKAPLVVLQLVCRCDGEVHAGYICQPDQVEQHVRQLLPQARPQAAVRRRSAELVGRKPLHELGDLSHLADERQREGLEVVEAPPVAGLGELAHPDGQVCQVAHRFSIGDLK